MKKSMIVCLITIVLLTAVSVQAVEIGDTFTYVINKAEASWKYTDEGSTKSGSTTKYGFGDTKLDPGQKITLNVTSKSGSLIEFTIEDEDGKNLANSSASSLGFALSMLLYYFYPLLGIAFLSLGDSPDFDNGVSIGDTMFFVPADIEWDIFADSFGNATFWEELNDDMNEHNEEKITFSGNLEFLDNNETVAFSCGMNGKLKNTTDDSTVDITISYNLLFHYAYSGRHLKGARLDCDLSGKINSTETELKVHVEIIKDGYSLPAGGGLFGIPGFELIVAALSIGILVIIRKKKQ